MKEYSVISGKLLIEGKCGYFINNNPTFKFSLFQGWHPVCDKNSLTPKELSIEFNVPDTNASDVEVCATLTGPEKYLPTFLEKNCNRTHSTDNKVTCNMKLFLAFIEF